MVSTFAPIRRHAVRTQGAGRAQAGLTQLHRDAKAYSPDLVDAVLEGQPGCQACSRPERSGRPGGARWLCQQVTMPKRLGRYQRFRGERLVGA